MKILKDPDVYFAIIVLKVKVMSKSCVIYYHQYRNLFLFLSLWFVSLQN